ncbi:hypothetical protein ACFL6I_00330 [candidate division KSB1 bacterium]
MNRKNIYRTTIFILTGLCCSPAFSQTVETIGGVTYVHNLTDRHTGEIDVGLEFIQEIGGTGAPGPEYSMSEIRDVVRDRAGNILVLDSGNSRIQKFDTGGNYLSTYGAPGQNPGELDSPLSLDINSADLLCIKELSKRTKLISDKGIEVKRIFSWKLADFENIRFLNDESLIMVFSTIDTWKEWFITDYIEIPPLFSVVNLSGRTVDSFGTPYVKTEIQGENERIIVFSGIAYDVDDYGYIYITEMYKNRIEKKNSYGTPILVIDRSLEYETEAWNEERKNGRVYFSNIVSRGIGVDQNGRIWVATYFRQPEPLSFDEGETRFALYRYGSVAQYAHFEIFSSEGILLGSIPLPADMLFWRIQGDRLYFITPERNSVTEYKIVER